MSEIENSEFLVRAPKQKRLPRQGTSKGEFKCESQPTDEYCPGKSLMLSHAQKSIWNITEVDFFTIYFENVDDLLELFKESLENSGLDQRMSQQHRNQLITIWETMDPNMTMIPVNSLANIYKFRDFYHTPLFKSIGKKGCVQAGTVRARYVSLGFFLQFLRKYQIFAGMSRMQIQILEQAMNDFNKDLHPLIQQRKVEVRKNKRKNLLTSMHFINFGQSKFVQDLIKRFKSSSSISKFTSGFAVDFRNYVITSVVIGNGLRASNVMELQLSDFKESTKFSEYPGHNIIVNDCYKTSTIYGEKFIVVPDELLKHYFFYAKKLRPLIYSGKSKKAFVTSGNESKMTQTNVASSLTAAFKKSNIFHKSDYSRVSCTRIRCGLATFACNEGGMDTAYVANHFMKNKEETTALHYNLLANRRHALHIAMKLYDSFNVPGGEEIKMKSEELKKCYMKPQTNKKENVIEWLKKNDSSLTTTEIKEFEGVLDEFETAGLLPRFYGKEDKKVC